MRNATALKPLDRPPRSAGVIAQWQSERSDWLASIAPPDHFHRLFDHVPDVYFFAKNRDGKLMFASEGLRRRYGMTDESEILGMTDFDLNPNSMAQAYVDDDRLLLDGTHESVERLELWWDQQQMPDWFHVTKLPIHDREGVIIGLMGLLRRPDAAERQLPVFQTVAQAVEIIRRDFARELLIAEIARDCGQSLRQLQRRFQSAFGISPQEFLVRTRVLAAVRLLETSVLGIAEVARACGFLDASRFAQQFKKRIGVTPASYRASRRPK
jgi:AraC-like DNA-binding protein